jgi:hypothetical protein
VSSNLPNYPNLSESRPRTGKTSPGHPKVAQESSRFPRTPKTCPGHRNNSPGKGDYPPGKHDGPPGKYEGPPGKHDGSPGRRDGPPGNLDDSPGKLNGPPGKRDSLPGKQENLPAKLTISPNPLRTLLVTTPRAGKHAPSNGRFAQSVCTVVFPSQNARSSKMAVGRERSVLRRISCITKPTLQSLHNHGRIVWHSKLLKL